MRTSGAVELVESVLDGHHPPSPRTVDALRGLTLPDDPAEADDDDRIRAAARIMALSRMGQVDAASALAQAWREVPSPSRGASPLVALGPLGAIVEAEIAAGRIAAAEPLAERMLTLALDVGEPAWIRRALGLRAAASALSGDLDSAAALLARITRRHPTEPDAVDDMAEMADALVAFAALDGPRLDAVGARLRRLAERDAHAGPLGRLVEAAAALVAGDGHRMTALTSRLVRGSGPTSFGALVPLLALGLQAFALVRDDEPMRALGVLRETTSDEEHIWCPSVLRAAARLRLGDPRSALNATTGCVRMRNRHSLHTLGSILLIRGIAHLRLQMTSLGRREIGEAFAVFGQSTPAATFALLHPVDQRMVLTAVDDDQAVPEAVRAALHPSSTSTAEAPAFPVLTPRERAVAAQLSRPQTFAEIAASLHVAPSTVKTQALSIYRKLRVSTRDDAVGLLEQSGYFEQ